MSRTERWIALSGALSLALFAGCFRGGVGTRDGGTRDGGASQDGATGGLISCGSGSTEPQCDAPGNHAPLGAGPHFYGLGGLWGGVVDTVTDPAHPRLIVGGTWGAVVTFDITTGERRLLSGSYRDDATGVVTQRPAGTGSSLPPIFDVQLTSTGQIIAIGEGTDGWGIYRIDNATGAFTLVANEMTAGCVDGLGAPYFQYYARQGFAIGPQNEMFFWAASMSGPRGVIGISADGHHCRVVSAYLDPGYDPPPQTLRGTGPGSSINANGFRYQAGYLWYTDSPFGTQRLDITTGNWITVGGAGPDGYSEAAHLDVRADASELIAYGVADGDRYRSAWFYRTDLGTNATVEVMPAYAHWFQGMDYGGAGIWYHPTRPLYIAIADEAMIFIDPATGNMNRISQ